MVRVTQKGGMRPAVRRAFPKSRRTSSPIETQEEAIARKKLYAFGSRDKSAHERRVAAVVSSAKRKKRKKLEKEKAAQTLQKYQRRKIAKKMTREKPGQVPKRRVNSDNLILGYDNIYRPKIIKKTSPRKGLRLRGVPGRKFVRPERDYVPYRVTSSARKKARKEKKRIRAERRGYSSTTSSSQSFKELRGTKYPYSELRRNPPLIQKGREELDRIRMLTLDEQERMPLFTASEITEQFPGKAYSDNSLSADLRIGRNIGRKSSSVKRYKRKKSSDRRKKSSAAKKIQSAVKKRQKRKKSSAVRKKKAATTIQKRRRGNKVRNRPMPPPPSSSDSASVKRDIDNYRKEKVYNKMIRDHKDNVLHKK